MHTKLENICRLRVKITVQRRSTVLTSAGEDHSCLSNFLKIVMDSRGLI
jgi:hypothetical protein